MGESPQLRRWGGWKGKASLAVTTLAAAALATAATMSSRSTGGPRQQAEPVLQERIGLQEMVIKPSFESCSRKSENCLSTKCCAVSGYQCFQRNVTYAQCMKTCKPKSTGDCATVAPHTAVVVEEPGLSLFCFSVYTANTGSTKKSYELELLKEQKRRGVSIFSCAVWSVYSDVVAELAPGISTVQVSDMKGDFHALKRKTGSWVNTGMFVQVWKQIAAEGAWAQHNWVVKVDPDAVFFPAKLIKKLDHATVPAQGIYMENCKYVDYGYFGNLEVFSHQAFSTLLLNVDTCYSSIDWKLGVDGGKWGPMGEDLFAQKCMDAHGVAKVEAFDLTTDGACPADRPEGQKKNKKYQPPCDGTDTPSIHPFKKPDEYFKCMDEASPTVIWSLSLR